MSLCAEQQKLLEQKQKSFGEVKQQCMLYIKNRGKRKHLPNKKTRKRNLQSSNVVNVEAATSQNDVLHLENPVTTVERAITMQDVAKQLQNRKFTQLMRKKRMMRSSLWMWCRLVQLKKRNGLCQSK